jgi:hypothetical protein
MGHAIIVGTYPSRTDAEAARGELVARGIAADRITVEQRAPRASPDASASPQDEPGFAGIVARMFSGALHVDALSRGHYVVAVHAGSRHQAELASAALVRGGPRTYSLPNAPTAWNEAAGNDPASVGGVEQDPGRPEGLLRDAKGLPASGDEAALERRSRRR